MPIIISNIPEIRFHILFGIFDVLFTFSPNNFPIVKNINWNEATNNGNSREFRPNILLPIPMQNESIDNAIPKYIDSFVSMMLELSISEDIGFFIICMVIPRNFIKN